MNRFLINLRSLDFAGTANSDAQHFSRFSVANFRVPESILGNIGQPLEHSSEQGDADDEAYLDIDASGAAAGEHPVIRATIDRQSEQPLADISESGTRWEDNAESEAVSSTSQSQSN
jgi:hypothetical protein